VPVEGNPVKITLPVDTAHVGCVMVPITGAGGIEERGFITATADEGEIHPVELVTVKV
jgi:hypothetical protein